MSDDYNPRVTPWTVEESAFPARGTVAEQIRFLLNYAILAPSGHNTQPWKFRADPERGRVMAYADYARRLTVVDPDDRELVMSIAAALFNLRVAAAHFGLRCEVKPAGRAAGEGGSEPPAGCELLAVAEIRAGEPETGLADLFPAITRRRTNRAPYEPRALEGAHRDTLASLTPAPAGLCLIEDSTLAGRLAELVAEGDRRQMGDPSFRDELASWVRPDVAGEDVAGDGFGLPDLIAWGGAWFIRTLNLGAFAARRDAGRAHAAAALAIIYAPDTLPDLLAAGELLERLLLTLTALGIESSYLNQPIEVASLRGEVQSALGLEAPPQILLRLGYCAPLVHAMPRRRLDDVLLP